MNDRQIKLFVPRFMDRSSHNAQNLNARRLLPQLVHRFDVVTVHYDDPISGITKPSRSIRLWRGRLYPWHKVLLYQGRYDAIFYPGHIWYDVFGLLLRRLSGRKVPVISTLEGMPWVSPNKKRELELLVGHPIYCMDKQNSKFYNRVLEQADHVIAISPFLARIGKHLYGDKFSVIPLGIDPDIFYYAESVEKNETVTVVCAGTVYDLKRPELFIAMAETLPQVNFIWYGGDRGNLLYELRRKVEEKGLTNIIFMGSVNQVQLADAFRRAHLFVLPSLSEGVPKVSQEAAACGLPLVLFGFYEAPTVVHGENGFVVWDDNEFIETVSEMVRDRDKLNEMGKKGAKMAINWDWDSVAPQWESELMSKFKLPAN